VLEHAGRYGASLSVPTRKIAMSCSFATLSRRKQPHVLPRARAEPARPSRASAPSRSRRLRRCARAFRKPLQLGLARISTLPAPPNRSALSLIWAATPRRDEQAAAILGDRLSALRSRVDLPIPGSRRRARAKQERDPREHTIELGNTVGCDRTRSPVPRPVAAQAAALSAPSRAWRAALLDQCPEALAARTAPEPAPVE